jgi:hypothetical protein
VRGSPINRHAGPAISKHEPNPWDEGRRTHLTHDAVLERPVYGIKSLGKIKEGKHGPPFFR